MRTAMTDRTDSTKRWMRRGPAALLIAGLTSLGALSGPIGPAAASDTPELRAEARAMVKRFAAELQGALKGAVQAQGFGHAIGVCKTEAPAIAGSLSTQTGWQVARTALRLRNPKNAPDPIERAVLEDFRARAEAGGDLKTMEQDWVVESGDTGRYRYMKAIPLGELCASCHGTEIAPELAATIRAAYPEDQATGFKPGELRGAFTLTKPLN